MRADPILARLYDVASAATYLGLSVRSTWSLIHSGRIPRVKLGRLVRVDLRDLELLVQRAKRGVDVFGPSLRPERPPPKTRGRAALPDQGSSATRPTQQDAPEDSAGTDAEVVTLYDATARAPTGCPVREGDGR